ncbi:hypothetical protein DXA13_15205 [Clostridium sp. AM58-1XD]|nr:hypothetical protein DXA13_15205 [Clostridium sp. AM58-1XD]
MTTNCNTYHIWENGTGYKKALIMGESAFFFYFPGKKLFFFLDLKIMEEGSKNQRISSDKND